MVEHSPEHIVESLIGGDLSDPFAFLGMHKGRSGGLVIRVFLPTAQAVTVLDGTRPIGPLARLHEAGLFVGTVKRDAPFAYRLLVETAEGVTEIEDPYRFPPVLGDLDLYLLAEGTHLRLYEKLGAHPMTLAGIDGMAFAVWAPSARRVSVVGPFNGWDGRVHAMRRRVECGVWEIFLPGLPEGSVYNYEIQGPSGNLLPLKADPFAFHAERAPRTGSVACALDGFPWSDKGWLEQRVDAQSRHAPISIYEVHLGSWKRHGDNSYLTYRELARDLIPHVKELGFTHMEILPISEHPFDGSWGYQPISLFAPTSRFGSPQDFAAFIDAAHAEGLGVILDWVPGHFPNDRHGLSDFDGTHLYEHADPRQGHHAEWNTLIYNYGRREVSNFLLSNALFWLERYHADGLRVDAVASMLYLDYSRIKGQWVANRYGGNENLEAIAFIKRMNELVFGSHSGTTTMAEESTVWPLVTRPTTVGGLGFGYKWNMGWMNDTLAYMTLDPLFRKQHHDALTFGLLYAFRENFVLALSHDEVVHGKRSLLSKMPGDRWQQFANLRAYYGFMFTYPGKKLLFMGCEFGQGREWNHDTALEWNLLDEPDHQGIMALVRDLNRLYRDTAALHECDCEARGFAWLVADDRDNSIIAYRRIGRDPNDWVIVVCNFTPVPHLGYRIGVPEGPMAYQERLNTDSAYYGGGDIGNLGGIIAVEPVAMHGQEHSINLVLPPLATLVLVPSWSH